MKFTVTSLKIAVEALTFGKNTGADTWLDNAREQNFAKIDSCMMDESILRTTC